MELSRPSLPTVSRAGGSQPGIRAFQKIEKGANVSSRDAGFALVGMLTQTLVNEVVRVYWASLTSPLTFQLPTLVIVEGLEVSLSGVLELLTPEVSLAASADNLVQVRLAVAGSLSATVGGQETSALILLAVTTGVALTITTTDGSLVPGLDLSQATISDLALYVLEGPALPSAVNAALDSSTVSDALQDMLRAIPPSLLRLAPSVIPSQFTADNISVAFGNIVVIPMDGVLAVAGDLIGYTQGDATALVDLFSAEAPTGYVWLYNEDGSITKSGGNIATHGYASIAIVTNGSALVSFLNGPVANAIKAYPVSHATITGATFSLADYQLPLQAGVWYSGLIFAVDVATVDGLFTGTLTIDFAIRLWGTGSGDTGWVNTRPKIPVWLIQADHVDISFGWQDYLIAGVLLGVVAAVIPPLAPIIAAGVLPLFDGVIPSLIEGFQQQVQQVINAGIDDSSTFGGNISSQVTTTLPGTTGPSCLVTVQDLVISADGFDFYGDFSITSPATQLILNGAAIADDATQLPAPQGDWNFSLQPDPTLFRMDDPTVRVAWQIAAPGLAKTFSSDTRLMIAGSLEKAIPAGQDMYAHVTRWTISVRIYRPLGDRTDEIWSQSILLVRQDVLDLDYLYVKWALQVYFRSPDNTAYWSRKRTSVLHKTDPQQRCNNVTKAAVAHPVDLVYTNDLPFPAEEANANRRGIYCDYCFFGGPNYTNFMP
jgi:hypothetical protein